MSGEWYVVIIGSVFFYFRIVNDCSSILFPHSWIIVLSFVSCSVTIESFSSKYLVAVWQFLVFSHHSLFSRFIPSFSMGQDCIHTSNICWILTFLLLFDFVLALNRVFPVIDGSKLPSSVKMVCKNACKLGFSSILDNFNNVELIRKRKISDRFLLHGWESSGENFHNLNHVLP